jgi:hypothetical protein
MSLLLTGLGYASKASAAGAVATLVAVGLRRWRIVVTLARATVIAGLLTFLVSTATLVALPSVLGPAIDPAERAIVLSRGVSELMNGGALAGLAAACGALLWGIGRRRLRAASRREEI